MEKLIGLRNLRAALLSLAGVASFGVGVSDEALAQTTLTARLVPSVVINGPLGSLQQIQYSTNLAEPAGWNTLAYVRLDTTPKSFYDETAHEERRFYRTEMVGVADTNLVWIPPGTFLMGSPADEEGRVSEEGPQTLVTLTRGYLIGRYEVKNSDWLQHLPAPFGLSSTNVNAAVDMVSWADATNYCAIRTAAEVLTGHIPPGWHYRLPTEAEWEYACRAGTTTPFGVGSGSELRNDAVRTDAEFNGSFPYPSSLTPVEPRLYDAKRAVGQYAPNAFGLHDMHGNVSEWCWDNASGSLTATGNLPGGSVTNLVGATNGIRKILRGPTGTIAAASCRSAFRWGNQSGTASSGKGFRVVLIPAETP